MHRGHVRHEKTDGDRSPDGVGAAHQGAVGVDGRRSRPGEAVAPVGRHTGGGERDRLLGIVDVVEGVLRKFPATKETWSNLWMGEPGKYLTRHRDNPSYLRERRDLVARQSRERLRESEEKSLDL